MSTFERDEVTRILLQQELDAATTRAQQLKDLELRHAVTKALNKTKALLAGVRPPLRVVVGPFRRPSTAGCYAAGDDLPPDGPEAA